MATERDFFVLSRRHGKFGARQRQGLRQEEPVPGVISLRR